MEKFPELEDFDDIGVVRPFLDNMKAAIEWVRDQSEQAPNPVRSIITAPQKIIGDGLKRVRSAISLTELPVFGDNHPAEPAMVVARLTRDR